jgi:predicted permease
MELLPLPFIGWFFTIASIVALGLGALLIIAMHRAGEGDRNLLAKTAWNDMALFGIWILGLAGGIGVLQLQPWGRHVLELFCWTLIVLITLSAGTRLYGIKQENRQANWIVSIAGALVVVIPLVAICGATIATLRSDSAYAAFAR